MVAAADLLALTVFVEPAQWGADVVVGKQSTIWLSNRFWRTTCSIFCHKRGLQKVSSGRIVGRSKDRSGQNALRLALQTREQHIRREKATSNICTAQVLPAVIASMYALYHGPEGLKAMASKILKIANGLSHKIAEMAEYSVLSGHIFDTIKITSEAHIIREIRERALEESVNLRYYSETEIGLSIDETFHASDLEILGKILNCDFGSLEAVIASFSDGHELARQTAYLEQAVFIKNRSEQELTRYIHRLAKKDITLADSMIPLGSCTMKLNASSQLEPIAWSEFNQLHPYAPEDQSLGYKILTSELSDWLAEITGFSSVSLQPNSGASGEYAGLVAIRSYHESRNEGHRTVCLIPESAHGTNPASSSLAGFTVITVNCLEGCVDVDDLRVKEKYRDVLGAFMLTYPSTYGIYESAVRNICEIIHEHGGQVYLDGANMNAMVGLCRPGDFGADVCHLNLHKTFCIPHGGAVLVRVL